MRLRLETHEEAAEDESTSNYECLIVKECKRYTRVFKGTEGHL